MIKFIAVATFALTLTTSAQSMSPAPLHHPDGLISQVAAGCGVGRTESMVYAWREPRNDKPAAPSAGVEPVLLADLPYGELRRPKCTRTRAGHITE